MISRKPIFDCVRKLRHGQGFTLDEVHLLDSAIDAAVGVVPAEPSTTSLKDPAKFFAALRSGVFAPSLSTNEVNGCNALVSAMGSSAWGIGWAAYGLATAYHETAGTMTPLREYGRGQGKPYGKPGKYGQPQYGRGFVQLTWDKNYEKADSALGLDGKLLANFDLALDPSIAASILVRGMQEGWFTGKKLGDFLAIDAEGDSQEFKDCRVIVNGHDKDTLIAGYAIQFQTALQEGAWS